MDRKEKALMDEVVKQVNNYFDTDVKIKSKRKEISKPRMIACYIFRKMSPDTILSKIGDYFGLGHATVIHAINTTETENEIYKDNLADYFFIRSKVELSDAYKNSDSYKASVKEVLATNLYKKIMSKDINDIAELIKTL